ncbi:MAG TPA: hypothetical protein DDZ51_22655 [Planctomycetaceae bacterium]|nr:hypothetical protein [Planctomycetaceae bacterium]
MKPVPLILAGVVALVTVTFCVAKFGLISKAAGDQAEAVMPQIDVAPAAYDDRDSALVESGTSNLLGEQLPGLVELLSSIPDEDQRAQLETSIEAYLEAAAGYKDAMEQLPQPVVSALLAGDEDAVAKAAAEKPAIIEQIVTVQQRYTNAQKARDAVTLAIAAVGNPSVATDVNRILAIIDSDLPDADKFKKILEVIVRRLLFLLKALAAAETGAISSDLVVGVAEDLEVVRGAFTRLATGGADGNASSLEAYLPDGSKFDFLLPKDIDLQRIEGLMNPENSVEFLMQDGQPTLRIVNPNGDTLLHLSQPANDPALIIVD